MQCEVRNSRCRRKLLIVMKQYMNPTISMIIIIVVCSWYGFFSFIFVVSVILFGNFYDVLLIERFKYSPLALNCTFALYEIACHSLCGI